MAVRSIYTDMLVSPQTPLVSILSEKMKSNTLHSCLSQRWADVKSPFYQDMVSCCVMPLHISVMCQGAPEVAARRDCEQPVCFLKCDALSLFVRFVA